MSTSSQVQEAPRGIPWVEVLQEREQQLAKLRQEEQYLQELISTTNLEEARKALESVLAVKVARTKGEEKVVAALRAGYDPMTSAIGGTWTTGFLVEKDPLPWLLRRNETLLVLLGFFVAVGGGGFISSHLFVTIAMVVVGLPLMVAGSMIPSKRQSVLGKAGLPTRGEVYFITKDRVPEQALTKFARAQKSGLFDSIQVLAPRKMFSRVAVGDPFIFGSIHATGDLFLIAQFNLGEDLKHIGS